MNQHDVKGSNCDIANKYLHLDEMDGWMTGKRCFAESHQETFCGIYAIGISANRPNIRDMQPDNIGCAARSDAG